MLVIVILTLHRQLMVDTIAFYRYKVFKRSLLLWDITYIVSRWKWIYSNENLCCCLALKSCRKSVLCVTFRIRKRIYRFLFASIDAPSAGWSILYLFILTFSARIMFSLAVHFVQKQICRHIIEFHSIHMFHLILLPLLLLNRNCF